MTLNAAMKMGLEVLRSANDTELNRDAEPWKYQLRSNEEINKIVLNFKDYLGTKNIKDWRKTARVVPFILTLVFQ